MNRATVWLAILVALVVSTVSYASEGFDTGGPKPVAVQNRMHTMRNEYLLAVGTLPMDAFTKGLTFTGAYTLHFDDLIAWEIAQFTYSVGVDTRLKGELENLTQPVGPTPFEVVKYYATSNFVFKPIYGKITWLNRSLVSHEAYLVVGGGVGKLSISSMPVIDVGAGVRVYGSKHVSVRLDVRDYFFFNLDDSENELWVSLGLSLGFGGHGG